MSEQPDLNPEEQATADRLRQGQEERVRLLGERAFLEYEPPLIRWRDKEFAAREADLSKVIKPDGSVDRDALVAAVDDLVTRAPYLVAPLDLGVEDPPRGPTGYPVGSGRRYRPSMSDYAVLKQKYPAAYPND